MEGTYAEAGCRGPLIAARTFTPPECGGFFCRTIRGAISQRRGFYGLNSTGPERRSELGLADDGLDDWHR